MGKAKLPVGKVKKSKSKSKPKNIGSNTAAHAYVSNFNTIKVCNDNKKAIAERCKPENYELKKSRIASTIQDILKLKLKSKLDFPDNTGSTLNSETKWIENHCEFLLLKPGKEAGFWKAVEKKLNSTNSSIPNEIKDKYETKKRIISPTALDAAMMHGLSVANPCINARRCNLVKYGDTNVSEVAKKGEGCCPGQTGHHLLPSAMFAHCTPPYVESQAPTICAEGANNSNGSHGNIHRELRTILGNLKNTSNEAVPYNSPIEMKDAIASGVASVNKAFPASGCNPKCIKAQLDEYYKEDKLCRPNSHPGIEKIPDKVVVKVNR